MKPQDIFAQIINVTELLESSDELFMAKGTTEVELPDIPVGTTVLASFLSGKGLCEMYEEFEQLDDAGELPEPKSLGVFAMKLTLEPITE